ncbi:MAG: hypothetical protein ACLQU1_09480 [Bryobacteraceae bacterium]
MRIGRRAFVQAAGTGLAALAGSSIAFSPAAGKNWVWIPNGGAVRRSADDWKRRLALMRESLKAGASGVSLFSDGAMDDVKWKALRRLPAGAQG